MYVKTDRYNRITSFIQVFSSTEVTQLSGKSLSQILAHLWCTNEGDRSIAIHTLRLTSYTSHWWCMLVARQLICDNFWSIDLLVLFSYSFLNAMLGVLWRTAQSYACHATYNLPLTLHKRQHNHFQKNKKVYCDCDPSISLLKQLPWKRCVNCYGN